MEEENIDKNIAWGCIARLIERIDTECDRLEWDEAIDMVSDIFDSAENMNSAEMFFYAEQYLHRFLYRVKRYKCKGGFNRVERYEQDCREFYRVFNYDYKTFCWAKKNGFQEWITNDWLLIPVDACTPAQKRGFEKRIEKGGSQ